MSVIYYIPVPVFTERTDGGIESLDDARLCNLDFADDIALIDESWASMQLTTSVLQEEASKVGLYINPDSVK